MRTSRLASPLGMSPVSPVVLPGPPPPSGAAARTGPADGTYRSVQALRGVAALLVTLFHAQTHHTMTETGFRVGNAGVDIFFVISGFVIWTVVKRRPVRPARFMLHRVVRLVPLYWFFTLLLTVAWLAHPASFPHLQISLRHLLLSLAFIPHMDPTLGEILPVLGQGWTLNFEFFFYVMFAGILFLPMRWHFVTLCVLLLSLPAFALVLPPAPDVPILSLLSPMLIEFLGGIVIARLVGGGWRPPAIGCFAAMALGVAILAGLTPPAPTDDWARLSQFGAAAFLLVGGAVGAEQRGAMRVGVVLEWLGAASYSIYLTHTFVISVIDKVTGPAMNVSLFIAIASVGAALVGVAVYVLLERPLLSAMRGKPVRFALNPRLAH